ncbi:MAG: hypothetical protein HXS52_01780 [Theionarchaea archaeon]|nr:hypothetical protein [Theionarchaea archaeon]MBU7036634.1 hypothetical protein [Theionarchaea archaeon]
MMKLPIVVCLLIVAAITAYRDPNMTVPDQVEIKSGETGRIEVTLEHNQTTMWNVNVYVDTAQIDPTFLQRLEISADEENPIDLGEEISFGTPVTATIDITVEANSPAGEVRIPIVAAGKKGPCLKGCEPFLMQKSTTLVIKRQDPKLALFLPESSFEVLQGENVTLTVQLRNYGASTAFVEELDAVPDSQLTYKMQDPPRQIEPGTTQSTFMTVFTENATPGAYLIQVKLVYRDEIQNRFTDSKTVYITVVQERTEVPTITPTPSSSPTTPPVEEPGISAQYQYFLAGMFTGGSSFGIAVMLGLFLKKRRPPK